MALTEITTTFNLHDYFGNDFDPRRAKAWATNNADGMKIDDTSTGETRIGAGVAVIAADGTGTFTHWAPGADGNPASWQTTYHFDVPDRTEPRGRRTKSFGPYTVTASGLLTALEDEQAVPPTYLTTVTELLDTYVDSASASATSAAASAVLADSYIVADLNTSDGQMEALIESPSSLTSGALAATIATGAVARSPKLARFRADLANSRNARCTVMALGDSITEGDDATTEANRWIAHLRRILQRGWPSNIGREAVGYLPLNHFTTTFSEAWVVTGTFTENNNWGPGGRALRMEPGSVATATLTGTSIDILYGTTTFTGRFEVFIDGVSQGTTQTAAGSNTDGHVLNVVLPAGGAHTVIVQPSEAFPVIIEGVIVNDGNESSGVRVIDAGHWGWTSTLFAAGGNGGTSLQEVTATLAPSLLTIALTANDYKGGVAIATYTANMQAIITKARAGGADPDILLIAYPERSDDVGGGPTYAEYVEALAGIADADAKIALLDLRTYMTSVATDTLGLWGDAAHPTDKGHALIAEHVAGYILAGLHPVPKAAEPESIWIPANQLVATSGSPAINVFGGAYVFLAYDPTTQEQASATLTLPPSWTQVNVELVLGNPSASAGDAVMRCNLRQIPAGAAAEATLFDVTKTVTAGTQGHSSRVFFGTATVSPSKTTLVHAIRMAAAGGDTLAADYGCAGIRITRVA